MQISVSFAPAEAFDAAAVVASLAAVVNNPPGLAGQAHNELPHHAALPDVIRLYEQMAEGESPRFLEALTAQPSLFEEIAERMAAAADGGTLHSVPSMRAIYRNVRRREKGLLESGVIAGPVVQADFSNYELEGAGRYYLEADAREALAGFLDS